MDDVKIFDVDVLVYEMLIHNIFMYYHKRLFRKNNSSSTWKKHFGFYEQTELISATYNGSGIDVFNNFYHLQQGRGTVDVSHTGKGNFISKVEMEGLVLKLIVKDILRKRVKIPHFL